MKNQIEKKAYQILNELAKNRIYTSYRSILDTMYETASEKKQFIKASYILELINEDINN
jgi:hypothetical protein